MRVDIRLFLIAGFTFGLLASLAYPVSSSPVTPVPLFSSPGQEPTIRIQLQEFTLLPPGKMNHRTHSSSSSTSAKINISSAASAPLVDHSVLYGPHVTLNGTWAPLEVPGFPSITIKQTCLEFLYTIEQEHYGTITGPVLGGWQPDHNPREAYDYVYCEKGQNVFVQVEFGTWTAGEGSSLSHGAADDLDIFAWAPGVEHTYANSLGGMNYGCNPESITFRAPVKGNYTIGIDYYSGVVPMGWRCYVYRFGVKGGTLFDGRSAVEDTADIGFNGNFDVRLRLITGTSLDADDSYSSHVIGNVTFINFFSPNVTVLTPGDAPSSILGPYPIAINWTGFDPNTDETLQYTVEVSNDLGESWKVIAYTTQTSTIWDPQSAFYGLPPTPWEVDGTRIPNFLVRVNVMDGQYNASDTSDHAWILDDYYRPFLGDPTWTFVVVLVVVVVVILIAIDVAVFIHRRYKPKKKLGEGG